MGFFDTALIISIALMYNLLVNSIASASYKELQFNEKNLNTSVLLILFGGIGILRLET